MTKKVEKKETKIKADVTVNTKISPVSSFENLDNVTFTIVCKNINTDFDKINKVIESLIKVVKKSL